MKKTVYILSGTFVVLLLIAYVVMQKPGEQSASSASSGPLCKIDSVSVDKIELKSPAADVVLEKRGAEWFVTQPINYRADQNNVGQLLHQLKTMETKGVISSRPDKQKVFQVDQSGTQVNVSEKGAEKAAFILGKMAGSYDEYYARRVNANDVLLVGGAYAYTFNRQVRDWRDRAIAAIPRESIKDIRYQYGDTVFTLLHKDSLWVIGQDKAQQSVVDGILSALSNIQADEFIDSTIVPKISALVTAHDIQLRFSYDKSKLKYYVQSSQAKQWFVLDPWKANQILKRKLEILGTVKK